MITNILAGNRCTVKIDTPLPNQILTLQSVTGVYNPILLDIDDFIVFDKFTFKMPQRIINIDIQSLNNLLTDLFAIQYVNAGFTYDNERFYTDITSMITEFPLPILDCSARFKHIYGENPAGSLVTRKYVQTNGPLVQIIKSKNLNTEMRFSDQRDGTNIRAPIISNVVSINLNQFSIGFPFVLAGNTYKVTAEQLKGIEFNIVDIYEKDITLINDVVWTFFIE
jgi:hypothetical protein